MTEPISVTVSAGVAISAKSTSTAPRDHVGVNGTLGVVDSTGTFTPLT